MDDALMAALRRLEADLRACNETTTLGSVTAALEAPPEDLERFLVSNELWGGAGSIADQAGLTGPGERRDCRRRVEAALIDLGEAQLAAGKVNVRTAMWVGAFKQWQQQGV